MQSLTKRLSFLAVVMVLAIGTLGAAYTLWYEDLSLHADVTTGELEGQVRCGITGDNDSGNFSWELYPDPGKNVGDITSSGPLVIDPSATPTPLVDPHTWIITAVNGYPGYAIDCELELFNRGTVPWHIEWIDAVVHKDGQPLVLQYPFECETPNPNNSGNLCWAGHLTPDGNIPFWQDPTGDPIYFEIADLRGCQVHGPTGVIKDSFKFGINQTAMEDSTYSVWLKYRLHQWNESSWDNCGDLRPPATVPPVPPT